MKPRSYTRTAHKQKQFKVRGVVSPPLKRAYQFVIQYEIVSPENMYASNIIEKVKVILMNIYVYTYIISKNWWKWEELVLKKL